MAFRAGSVLENGIRETLRGPKAAGIRYILVLVCLLGGSLAVFAAAAPHAQGRAGSTGTGEAQASGFVVRVTAARATGLGIEVALEVAGRPEIGDLVFTPAPALLWPDGQELRPGSGRTEGRQVTFAFDRPDPRPLATGMEFKLLIDSIASRSGTGPPHEGPPTPPTYLTVQLSEATNPSVQLVSVERGLGFGSAVISELWQDHGAVRVRGYLVGYAPNEIQATSMNLTALVGPDGATSTPAASRRGYGAGLASFQFDFEAGDLATANLVMAIQASPGSRGADAPRVAALNGTIFAEPIPLELDHP